MFQLCVGDPHPVQMEAPAQTQTPVCVQLDGLAPGVQQVQRELLNISSFDIVNYMCIATAENCSFSRIGLCSYQTCN